jgi:hypothetical protein
MKTFSFDADQKQATKADRTQAHNALCRAALDYLTVAAKGFAWKTWGGGYEMAGRADILCCLAGRFVAVEVKTGAGRPSESQKRFRDSVEKAGGLYVLCHDLEELEDALFDAGLIERRYL